MRAVVVALVGLAGCGRLAFDRHDAAASDVLDAPVNPCGFHAIGVGNNVSCALDAEDAVWCWGSNVAGQVTLNGPTRVETPTRVPLPAAAVQVRPGRAFTCARLVDGTVWCWGTNAARELGGAAPSPSAPVKVPLGGDVAIDLAVGGQSACVRRASDQSVVCWGDNKSFALGNAAAGPQPPTVVASTAGTKQLTMGHRHVCGIDALDRPFCWGRGQTQQLGDGMTSDRATPMALMNTPSAIAIGAGNRQTCAVAPSGLMRCFGARYNGGSQFDQWLGAIVLMDAVSVTVGEYRGCAIRANTGVACWGYVSQDGATLLTNTPMPMELTGVTEIDTAWYHYCAVANGEVVCWGNNDSGQLGRGTLGYAATPQLTTLAGTPTALSVGRRSNVCAVVGGKLYCWGANFGAQLGDGTTRARYAPFEVATGLSTVEGVTDGCAWGGGTARCWGENDSGQLGNGMQTTVLQPPVTVSVSNVSAVAASTGFACAITGATVQCWGRGGNGQLGNGGTADSVTPVTVIGVSNAQQLSANNETACAVAGGGQLYCWGRNNRGQIGDNSTTNRPTPVAITLTQAPAQFVASGSEFTCALDIAGNVYCWGSNSEGQLGQGDQLDRIVPTQVPLPANASRITTGATGACAVLVTGDTVCWGEGFAGQNASGTFQTLTSPTIAPALAGAKVIARGGHDGCAVVSGATYCWGARIAIGDDSETRPLPIAAACK